MLLLTAQIIELFGSPMVICTGWRQLVPDAFE